MDYVTVGFGAVLLLLMILNTTLGQIERDIILTPKQGLQINGKTIYYEPISNETHAISKTDSVPWETALKHLTYLTLNNDLWSGTNVKNLDTYKSFMKSKYIKEDHEVPKFGDIITLANGRLEIATDGQSYFIEGLCGAGCVQNRSRAVAFWQVQKIRHRDTDRNFRYEMKFTINPFAGEKMKTENGKREIVRQPLKTFILKDSDYPTSFVGLGDAATTAQRRYDGSGEYVDRSLNFNEILQPPTRRVGGMPELNIGEYIMTAPKMASSRVGLFPTTFRPNYHLKYGKPNYFDRYPESPVPVVKTVTHHMHHHFYNMAKDENSNEDNNYYTPSPITNQIPVPPQHVIKHTTVSVTSPIVTGMGQQTPIFYMHPIPVLAQMPVYLYPYNANSPTHSMLVEPRKTFAQSDKDETPVLSHFSEPDPLYAEDSPALNDEPTPTSPRYETNAEIESPNIHEQDSESQESLEAPKPDSINAQLPPPQDGQDIRIPYVETHTTVGTTTSTTTTTTTTTKPMVTTTTTTSTPEPATMITSTTSTTTTPIPKSQSPIQKILNRPRAIHRSTSERPVLKWKPKRKQTSAPTTTPNPDNITTKQSVSKSVSFKIGHKIHKQILTTATTTIEPTLDLYEANLIQIPTNSTNINLFKALEEIKDDVSTSEEKEDDEILAMSIVGHVKSLQ